MKVYLQDLQTGAYFHRRASWTIHREGAWNFQSVLDALDWSQNLSQMDLEVVLAFDDGQKDIRLSLGYAAPTLGTSTGLRNPPGQDTVAGLPSILGHSPH